MPADISPSTTLYFAYGSNLSPTQMRARCPSSALVGVARLSSARWFINTRGYANVVPLSNKTLPPAAPNQIQRAPSSHVAASAPLASSEDVWGLVYAMSPDDEAALDGYEGVPDSYGKEWHAVAFWPLQQGGEAEEAVATEILGAADPFGPERTRAATEVVELPKGRAEIDGPAEAVLALVYVDRSRVDRAAIQQEYVLRMQRGMLEAGQRGVPKEWMEKVIAAEVKPKTKADGSA